MSTIADALSQLKAGIKDSNTTLVAVSKTHPAQAVQEAYRAGQRDFGENKVQELTGKQEQLPKDIRWHLIGHLQTNKVKYVVPFIHLIHAVDSLKLLQEINKQAEKVGRKVNCLLQIYIAAEETKFGLDHAELLALLDSAELRAMRWIEIKGLMGMASNTEDQNQVRKEFQGLKSLFDRTAQLNLPAHVKMETLSMGMSGDYQIAIQEGSNMIRVGSAIFGARSYPL